MPATAREWIIAALELAGDLLVGRSAPRHQHHVKAGQAEDGDGQYGNQAHQDDSISGWS